MCLLRCNKKIKLKKLEWYGNREYFTDPDNQLLLNRPIWKNIILKNSPYYLVKDITLDELRNTNSDIIKNKNYLKSLDPTENSEIIVSTMIPIEEDLIRRLDYGPVLIIEWESFTNKIKYTMVS